jgi:hypothetical protein
MGRKTRGLHQAAFCRFMAMGIQEKLDTIYRDRRAAARRNPVAVSMFSTPICRRFQGDGKSGPGNMSVYFDGKFLGNKDSYFRGLRGRFNAPSSLICV